jgi:hypothetical protein
LTASAAQAASADGTSRSIILNPLTATAVQDLDFGQLSPGATPGTVVLDAGSGARIATGGVVLAGGAPSAAIFVGVARPNRMVHLNLPNGAITLTNGTGGTMTVTAFATDGAINRRTDVNGIVSFRVAATLNVAANQADGAYSGTFDVTLNLQ